MSKPVEWVTDFVTDDQSAFMENRDGIAWHNALIPRRLHWCRAQSVGLINYFNLIERCACGAIRTSYSHGWRGRNERIKHRRENKSYRRIIGAERKP